LASYVDDPLFITFLDEEHSLDKDRYITPERSHRNRLLLVAHTGRGGQIRGTSARKATSHEREFSEPEAASLSIRADLAACAAFLARLNGTKSVQDWLPRVIQERVELEKAVFIVVKQELATKAG